MAGNIAGIIRRLLVILIAVPLLCSCGGNHREKPYGMVNDIEVKAFFVKSGIGGNDYPKDLLILSDSVALLSTVNDVGTSFFSSFDKGETWKKTGTVKGFLFFGNFVEHNGTIYSKFISSMAESSYECVMKSENKGLSWKCILENDEGIDEFRVLESGAMTAVLWRKDRYSLQISKDSGGKWYSVYDFSNSDNTCVIGNKIMFLPNSHVGKILMIDINSSDIDIFKIDTLYTSDQLLISIKGGEDIVGIWEGHRANFYKVEDGGLSLRSSVRDVLKPGRNQIPAEIYQYGDVVYTKIIPLTYDAKMTTLMSTDGAKTWRRVDLSCPFEKQLDSTYIPDRNWPMAGYKESMVSYCVGYRDGRRQDYIKILRPKKNTSEGLRGCR